ncbi:hypothetical protein AB0I82_36195 [Streptomyces sp. NPDC050315]|uniref:hypothetical protein n=1 Tax=Streptomyces sp. NPDC050315 TaxID=3155039 RepID=UPI00342950EF
MGLEWGDVGTWTGGIAGVIGAVTGIVGMRQAKRANNEAEKGNRLAGDANKIARAANQLAVHANETSAESNEIARAANDIATAANRLAEDANALAHQQNQRDVEQHDVHWEGDWVEPGRYRLITNGEDAAFDVAAVVTVDDEEKRVTQARVAPGEPILLDFPEARRAYEAEQREYAEAQARRRRSTASWPYQPTYDVAGDMRRRSHFIGERILWSTELGTPKEHQNTQPLALLGDFD